MTRYLPAIAAAVFLAPADAARGADLVPTLEIVTFRLAEGTDETAFLAAARGTEAFLRKRGSVTGRWLTKDDDGLWTDVVHWASKDAALDAAAAVMEDPSFQPFMASIDPATVTMRHASVLWQME